MSRYNHSLCIACWTQRSPGRAPVTVSPARVEPCCKCGGVASSGIYVREEPGVFANCAHHTEGLVVDADGLLTFPTLGDMDCVKCLAQCTRVVVWEDVRSTVVVPCCERDGCLAQAREMAKSERAHIMGAKN